LLRVYLTASDLERAAWRDADLATAAKRSLDREARHAVQNLRHLRHHPSATDRSRPWTRWTGSARPRLALR
jgi:hypothetical protein